MTSDNWITSVVIIATLVALLICWAIFLIYTEKPKKKSQQWFSYDWLIIDPQLDDLIVHFDSLILHRHQRGIMMLIALISNQHVLLQWPPWSAKTTAVKVFGELAWLDIGRIQWTPDVFVSDIVWSEIYKHWIVQFDQWPIFHQLVLVDEINRLSPKVIAWLLQAMAEKTVTVWHVTYSLPSPFFVVATMNPFDQYGTYQLPTALTDRFGLISCVTHTDFDPHHHLDIPDNLNIDRTHVVSAYQSYDYLPNKQDIYHCATQLDYPHTPRNLIACREILKTRHFLAQYSYV